MEELTMLQWAKKGFVPNDGVSGTEGWNNTFYQYKVIRFSETEVHKDITAAKEIISAKNKAYREKAKKREQKRKEAAEYREKMKTKWQWLQEGRIPKDDARWESGEELNKTYKCCSYGSQYCYCHQRHTRKAKSSEELEKAISEFQKTGNSWV